MCPGVQLQMQMTKVCTSSKGLKPSVREMEVVPFCGVMSAPDSPWWPLCVGAACGPRQHT